MKTYWCLKRSIEETRRTRDNLELRKLDLARHLLLVSELAVNQISFDCGFEDTSHFIRVFKQKYLLTPNQYRLKYSKITKNKAMILQDNRESVE
jgi:AraC-like DNA-binding protein